MFTAVCEAGHGQSIASVQNIEKPTHSVEWFIWELLLR